MRVTYRMMTGNAAYWLNKQSERLYEAETVSASGKKVNRPSDDPAAAGEILRDRATISQYGQYQSNISLAMTWVEVSNENLELVYELLDQAKDTVSDQSSAEDLDTREAALGGLQDICQQIIDLANSQYQEGYMYSGGLTKTAPFADEAAVSGGLADDIVFELAAAAADVSIEIFDSAGEVVRTLNVTGGTEGTNTITWDGLDDSGTALPDGVYSFNVTAADSSGDQVASYPSYRGGSTAKSVLAGTDNVVTLNTDGGNLFSSALKSISQAITLLAQENNSAALSAQAETIAGDLDIIQAEMTSLSASYSRLGRASDRLAHLTLTLEKRLEDTEKADASQAALELESQKTAHEIALEAASLILNMNRLNDYL